MKQFIQTHKRRLIGLALFLLIAGACGAYIATHLVTNPGEPLFAIDLQRVDKAVFRWNGETLAFEEPEELRHIVNTLNEFRVFDAEEIGKGEIPSGSLTGQLEIYCDGRSQPELSFTFAQFFGLGVERYNRLSEGPDTIAYYDPLRPGTIVMDGYVCKGNGIPGLFRYLP